METEKNQKWSFY